MKKVKLMLLSLSILAVVGGALAFTVKQQIKFCTAPTVSDNPNQACLNVACPAYGSNLQPGGIFVCTTTTSNDPDAPCVDEVGTLPCAIPSVRLQPE